YERRIVGIGDLHGDLPNARKVLQMTDVIDEHGHWTGKVDFLVQTGDIIGDDTIALFEMMERLRVEARAKGGVILSNLGNHEWMNAIGDWRYVYESEIKTFGGVEARQAALSSTGWLGRAWAQNYTVTTRLPLHPSLGGPNTDYSPPVPFSNHQSHFNDSISHAALSFVHGGLAPNFPYLTPYPSNINGIGKSLLYKLQHRPQPPPSPPNPYPGLPASATAAEQYLYAGDGPLWYRGWAMDDEAVACEKVDEVLEKTGTRRLIMGHTPTFTNIVSRCGGKVIIIDTGISHAYGGVLSGLSITYSLHRLDAKGEPVAKRDGKHGSSSSAQRWLEIEKVVAVYNDKSRLLTEERRTLTGDYGV
ncbi:hypothetical protein M408DRAFT_37492, partial [Serendipita vermifera MAFF 305830]